jgi:hypothetical protein
MENETLYPELRNYIFEYCGKFFLESEKKASWHLLALSKSRNGENVKMYKFFMKEENVYADKEIMDLVDGGFESFKNKVITRVFNDHKEELELNLCPKCKKIARTPQARQCRFCLHTWREKLGKENES